VVAAFDGGRITSDAGVLLLREVAAGKRLFEWMAACVPDPRDPAMIEHDQPTMLAQRVLGIACGGDSDFCRWKLMRWCDRHDMGYVLGLARNKVLERTAKPFMQEAKRQYEQTGQKQRLFTSFDYAAGMPRARGTAGVASSTRPSTTARATIPASSSPT
jgi:hypothetical protein